VKIIKILALDQSTRLTGWCLMINKKYNSSGVLSVINTDDTIERMKLMYDEIVKLINRVKPDVILIEDTQFQNNYSSFRTLSQLQGIIMAYLFENDLPFYIIPATAWKSCCQIKGKARNEQKKNTQKYVKNTYGLDVSEDEADSIGIATYGINNIN
jgi:crossover junction endodeoxyribonuclease RuvC